MSSIVTSQPYPFEQIWWTETERMLFLYIYASMKGGNLMRIYVCMFTFALYEEGGGNHSLQEAVLLLLLSTIAPLTLHLQ